MVDLWTALKNDDTTANVMDKMVTFSEFNDLIGSGCNSGNRKELRNRKK